MDEIHGCKLFLDNIILKEVEFSLLCSIIMKDRFPDALSLACAFLLAKG
jgi:hypothetical protein